MRSSRVCAYGHATSWFHDWQGNNQRATGLLQMLQEKKNANGKMSTIASQNVFYVNYCMSSIVSEYFMSNIVYQIIIVSQIFYVKYCMSSIVCQILCAKYCASNIVCQILYFKKCLSNIVYILLSVKYCMSIFIMLTILC